MFPSSKDFYLGVAAAVLPWMGYQVWCLFQVSPPSAIQQRATAQLKVKPTEEDSKTITVWGFQTDYSRRSVGVLDGSPYVCRVECYLRLLGKPYIKKISQGLDENPRTKVPFANVFGTMVDDSSNIINAIQDYYHLDEMEGLSEEQQRNGLFVRRLLTGSFYWLQYYMAFATEIGRTNIRAEFSKTMSALLLPLIMSMVVRSQVDNLNGHGMGRRSHAQVVEIGKADLRALNSLLGKNQFILGTKEPTVFDTDVYSFVGHLFFNNDSPEDEWKWIREIREEVVDLNNYVLRMRNLLFPEEHKKTQ